MQISPDDQLWVVALGALYFIYGTVLTSFGAVLIAGPISIAIGLYLSELAPRGMRGLVGSLVEMLAAVPSVVIGLWGILVLGPFMRADVEPFLHDTVGWIPIFGGDPSQSGMLVAIDWPNIWLNGSRLRNLTG